MSNHRALAVVLGWLLRSVPRGSSVPCPCPSSVAGVCRCVVHVLGAALRVLLALPRHHRAAWHMGHDTATIGTLALAV